MRPITTMLPQHPEDPRARIIAHRKVLREFLRRMSTAPSAENRITLPSEVRFRHAFQALDDMQGRYPGEAMLQRLITLLGYSLEKLREISNLYNSGKGPACLAAIRKFSNQYIAMEFGDTNDGPNLQDSLVTELGKNLTDKVLRNSYSALVRARAHVMPIGYSFHFSGRVEQTFSNLGSALSAALLTIAAPPSKLVTESSLANAKANIREFMQQLNLEGLSLAESETCEGGRYQFVVSRGTFHCAIGMPGLELSEARRWYVLVHGSSWDWSLAVRIAQDRLTGKP